jgi:hypothetical protein
MAVNRSHICSALISDTVRHVSAFVESHNRVLQNISILSHELDGGGIVVPFPAGASDFSLLFPDRLGGQPSFLLKA